MADYTNVTPGVLSFKGKEYQPGEKIPISAEDRKNDPTVDWWIRSEFVKPAAEAGDSNSPVRHSLSHIPTFQGDTEGSSGESTKPVITETPKASAPKQ